jgi:hypothetical protein
MPTVKGRAEKGSQLQTQIYVNRRRAELDMAILAAVPSLSVQKPALTWASPLEAQSYREYHDAKFLRAVGLEALMPLLEDFWPSRGPHWDALAIVQRSIREPGVLLFEAKSYPEELEGGGLKATSPASKEKICRALKATQDWLAIPESKRDAWTGPHYQTANRLAHLYWLRKVADIDAWLVHLLVVNDPTFRRTPRAKWDSAVNSMKRILGLDEGFVPHFGHAYVDGLPKSKLN